MSVRSNKSPAQNFDNRRDFQASRSQKMQNSGGDINSLIQKIKPSNTQNRNRKNKYDYNPKKRPFKSALKKNSSRKRPKKVVINTIPRVQFVENWKFLNVDMSKEGKRYNRFNRGRRKRDDDLCAIF